MLREPCSSRVVAPRGRVVQSEYGLEWTSGPDNRWEASREMDVSDRVLCPRRPQYTLGRVWFADALNAARYRVRLGL